MKPSWTSAARSACLVTARKSPARSGAGDPGRDRADGLRGRRSEQVPRQARVGVAQAGWPHRDRARARGVVPPAAAGRCALGRRARHGEAACASAASTRSCEVRTADPAALRAAVGSMGGLARQARARRRRSPGRAEPAVEVVVSGVHVRARPHGSRSDARGDRRHGARQRDVAPAVTACVARTVTIKVRYSDFTTITRSDTRTGDRAIRTRSRGARSRCSARRRREPKQSGSWGPACTTSLGGSRKWTRESLGSFNRKSTIGDRAIEEHRPIGTTILINR